MRTAAARPAAGGCGRLMCCSSYSADAPACSADRRRVEPAELVLGEGGRMGLAGCRHLVEAVDVALGRIGVVVEVIEVLEAGQAVDQLHQPHAVALRHHHARPEAAVGARPPAAEHHQHGGVHALIAQAGRRACPRARWPRLPACRWSASAARSGRCRPGPRRRRAATRAANGPRHWPRGAGRRSRGGE